MTGQPDEPIVVSTRPATIEDVIRIADGARIELSSDVLERIAAGRSVVDHALAGPHLVYGLNTGLGSLRNERLPIDELVAYQDAIVASHAAGFGEPLPARLVRAAMAVRVIGIGRGGSGASPAGARMLVDMLNAHVHPVVPAVGSVGAADLMHMGAIAEVAIGRGRAEVGGEVVDGGQALRRAGLMPLRLGPKDGLAMISANGMSVGHAALLVGRGRTLLAAADVVLALSLEAAGANLSVLDPAVASAKGPAGHADAADHVRRLVDGGHLGVTDGRSVQDPLSFRVAPQVHGTAREFLGLLERAVLTELESSSDNPLVSIVDGRLISNGNFQPVFLALALDALRPALAHVGQLSDRRMSHLWDRLMDAPDAATPAGIWRLTRDAHSTYMRYAAASRYATLRSLAAPASLDVPPLDHGVEDHATNATETARLTGQALDALADILAVELLVARAAIVGPGQPDGQRVDLGRGSAAAHDLVEETLAGLGDGAPPDVAHAAVRRLLDGPLLRAADGATSNA
jgi:histidine ammonia-lyase